ncbi:MAG TPA: hypothetical protein VIM07_06945, partial [Chitinophagaceae bacterium]
MSNDRLKYLLEQYAADASTTGETKELFCWIRKSKDDALLKAKIKQLWATHKNDKELPEVDWNTIYTKIINTPAIGSRPIWPHIAAAAVIILLLSDNHSIKQITKTETHQQFKNDIAPGGNRAILT